MSNTTESQPKSKCTCTFCPYTHTEKVYDLCCIGCDKPGLGSVDHDPGDNSCNDCALLCLPCALILDFFCYIPMCLNKYTVTRP